MLLFVSISHSILREWIEEIEKCIKNDEGFKKRETLNEENEIAESFKRQNDLLSDKKRLLRTHLSVVDMTRDGPYLVFFFFFFFFFLILFLFLFLFLRICIYFYVFVFILNLFIHFPSPG